MHVSGFSWWAAVALPLWALHRRLYGLALLVSLTGVASAMLAPPGIQSLLAIAQFVACGALANRVHRFFLERRGWRVTAEAPDPATDRA
jgi:hypothetical protein